MAAKYHRRQIFKEEQQHFGYYNYYLLKERPKCQQANPMSLSIIHWK